MPGKKRIDQGLPYVKVRLCQTREGLRQVDKARRRSLVHDAERANRVESPCERRPDTGPVSATTTRVTR